MKTFIAPLLLLFAIACTNAKKSKPSIPSDSAIAQDSLYRFSVSFISIGSGIDHKAKKQFVEFISQFNSKNKASIEPEIVSWGREGETDYCFKLSGLNAAQQTKFIQETKEQLNASKNVRYNENCTCRKKRK
jgi:hypothetical protein